MAKITYEQAYADHAYLWDIAPAYDMTGGYVDQNDLTTLLRSPTKATARDCLCDQIEYWFQRGCDDADRISDWKTLIGDYPKLVDIAQRHGQYDGDQEQDDDA